MRNSECGTRNEPDLKKRTKAFALRILKLVDCITHDDGRSRACVRKSCVPEHPLRQTTVLLAARNRTPDFIAKMGIVEEEADETLFWLELLEESQLVGAAKLTAVKQEANELIPITFASIKTARSKRASSSAIRIPHSALE